VEQSGLTKALEQINRDLQSVAVIAPAVSIEASQPKTLDVNEMLFQIAKKAGDTLGVPTLASVPIGSTASASAIEVRDIVQRVTTWKAGGWYLLFGFQGNPVPNDLGRLNLWVRVSLDLAATGKPLLQGYQGLLSAVSVGLGSHGVALGQFKTLWHFDPDHWNGLPPTGRSNGPAKFFSVPLWHYLKFPDDFVRLPSPQGDPFLTPSPWSTIPQNRQTASKWREADARRHFMYVTTLWIDGVMALPTARARAIYAKKYLDYAVANWAYLGGLRYPTTSSVPLADWSALLDWALTTCSTDYDWLDLL
jgi:hypothetical protein